MTLGALYRAELSAQLHDLGFSSEAKKNWFELSFVPTDLSEFFSKRRAAIVAALARQGLESASAAAFAALSSREPKDIVPPRGELFQKWRAEARDGGWTRSFDAEHHRVRSPLPKASLDAVFQEAVTAIEKQQSHFNSHDLVRFVAEAAQAKGIFAEQIRSHVRESLTKSPLIFTLGERHGEIRYTTKQTLEIEKGLLRDVEEMNSKTRHRVKRSAVHEVLKEYGVKRSALLREVKHHLTQIARRAWKKKPRRFDRETVQEASRIVLSREQAVAVHQLTSNKVGDVRLLTGMTGTGKSTTLAAVREIYERSGFEVRGVTAMPRARNELTRRSGIKSETFASFMLKLRPSIAFQLKHHARQLYRAARKWPTSRLTAIKLTKKTVLVIDGAEAFSTADLAALVQAVKRRRGLVILAGEKGLRQSFGAGGAFASLCDRIHPSTLARPKRQRDPKDTELVRAVAQGNVDAVRSNLNERTPSSATHSAASITTAELDKSLRDRVRLTIADDRPLAIKTLISDWIAAEGRRPKGGIIFCGTRDEADKLNHECQAERLRKLHLIPGVRIRVNGSYIYKGDRVILRRTANALTARSGDTGTVTAINPLLRRITVRLDNNERVTLPLFSYKHRTGQNRGKVALGLCYAVSATDDWGTVERSYVLTGEIADRETLYSQFSRARERTHVYTCDSNVKSFWSAIAVTRQKSLAIDQMPREQGRTVSP